MNDSITMNERQSLGISARARAWGCGHAQARAQGPGAQGMLTAQGPASSTDANALALIHDDTIIHISVVPNPVMLF